MKKINWKNFKHAVIATDVVIFTVIDNELKVLLIKTNKGPFKGKWVLPGGLVNIKESVDNSAAKHLKNKTGLSNIYLEQLYSFGEVNRDPLGRVVSVSYFALAPNKEYQFKTTKEYDEIAWHSINEIKKLGYDHEDIIKLAIIRLKSKLEYTNIVYSLLPTEFTFTDLQKMYETILERKIDKRNFRKKILSLDIIKKTNKKTIGGANRPAHLYKFKNRKLEVVEII
ncbi:NUDIX hydrolase [Candidatus Parcubacteria bacterium]|nr:NUDIX hydrolase [Candidatus Parcubacteria bacterium]